MNEHDEHEWQAQESARRRARGNVSPDAADCGGTGGDLSDRSHDAVARGLRIASRDATPPDATSAANAILLRAASDRRTRKRFERRVLGALSAAYVLALAGVGFFLMHDVLLHDVLAHDLVPVLYDSHQQDLLWLATVALLCATGVYWKRR
jgi:hypothetical protein